MLRIFNMPSFGLLCLRLVLGISVLLHGIFKIYGGIDPVISLVLSKKLPYILSYGVYVGEILAPIMIILGIYTRFAAIILMILCGFILYLVPSPFALNNFGGFYSETVILYLGAAIALFFCGSGKIAILRD